jgi:hypothetical protein
VSWRTRPLAPVTLLLVACASAAPSGAAAGFDLPVASGATALASATLYTSPDGGIYQNPDPVRITMVARQSGEAVVRRLGAAASQWSPLLRLGGFTFVGIALHNAGKAWSDAQLDMTQIASDFAPDGTEHGPLRHFYHPMYALAMLSATPSGSTCTLHLESGDSAFAVLVYPPIRATTTIVWGIYQTLAVTAPFGGGVPAGARRWTVTACAPPQAAPA